MTKREFLIGLRRRLSRLPRQEVKERLSFYSEIIEDKIEEGLSEADAVADVGRVEEIAAQIIADSSLANMGKRNKVSKWQIILLAIGSPVWLPILLAIFITVWALIISLWAIELPFFIFSFLSKYFWIACVASTRFICMVTKKCAIGIARAFGAK